MKYKYYAVKGQRKKSTLNGQSKNELKDYCVNKIHDLSLTLAILKRTIISRENKVKGLIS